MRSNVQQLGSTFLARGLAASLGVSACACGRTVPDPQVDGATRSEAGATDGPREANGFDSDVGRDSAADGTSPDSPDGEVGADAAVIPDAGAADGPRDATAPDGTASMDAGTCSVLTLAQLAGGTQCPSFSSNVPAGVASVDLWIQSSGGAPSQTVTLPTNSPASAGGHTYINRGYGLFTTGVASGVVGAVYGDIGIEVDGVADQVRFRIEGCLAPVGDAGQTFVMSATLKRQQAGCDACAPDTIDRTYNVMRSSNGVYRFVDSSPAVACGVGVHLTQFTLN